MEMYERLLDKNNEPTPKQVKEYLGENSFRHLLISENFGLIIVSPVLK